MADQSTLGKFFKRADGTAPAAPSKQQTLKAAFKKANNSDKSKSKSNPNPKSESKSPPPQATSSTSTPAEKDGKILGEHGKMDVDEQPDDKVKDSEMEHGQEKNKDEIKKDQLNASKKRGKDDGKVPDDQASLGEDGEDQDDDEALAPSRKKSRNSKSRPTIIDSDSDSESDAEMEDGNGASSSLKSSSKSTPNTSTGTKSTKSTSSKSSSPVKERSRSPEKAKASKKEEKAVGKGKGKEIIVTKKQREALIADESEGSEADDDEENDDDDEEEEEEEDEEAEEEARENIAAIFLKGHKDSTSTEKKKTKKVKTDQETDFEVPEWKEGSSVPYSALAAAFSAIEATTKRILIMQILTKLLVKVIEKKPEELTKVVYLCINRIAPDYAGIELGIGETLLIKAIAQSYGRAPAHVKKELREKGDLGKVALNSRKGQSQMFKPAAHTVPKVFASLTSIAKETGSGSQAKKVDTIVKLLGACQGDEAKFLIRSLEGKLRIGLALNSVTTSLAHAATIHENLLKAKKEKITNPEELKQAMEKGTEIVKQVFSELPNFDLVCEALLKVGLNGLTDACKLTPGVPLKPMLAKPTKAISEVLDRFEGKPFTCEYKYDGERSQIHYYPNTSSSSAANGKNASPSKKAPTTSISNSQTSIGVFSRNSENMLNKYPDLVVQVPHAVKQGVESFVLDAEVVAWQKEKKTVVDGKETIEPARLLPFQELSKRKRKNVAAEEVTVAAKLYAFDLLFLNGVSLLHLPLSARREKLRESFNIVPDEFEFAAWQDCNTVDEIQAMLDESIKASCEGLMVKMLEGSDSFYEPSRRSMNWLKLKKDYLNGMADSFDLVVIGAYHGQGKRTKVYGAFLLACYDPDTETYQAITKVGTGLSDSNLLDFYQTLHPLEIASKKGYYDIGGVPKPDVYFDPKVVWEVKAADLSVSPAYSAAKGLVDESKGLSLRFPRFVRVRDDKDPDESTGPEQIAEMFNNQAVQVNNKGGKKTHAEDFY